MPLTIKEIENAKPREKKYKLADRGGLCLVVQPWGGKFWLWRYPFDGTEKNMTFGDDPHAADLVRTEIVHHHHVAWTQCRAEHLLDVDEEDAAVGGLFANAAQVLQQTMR